MINRTKFFAYNFSNLENCMEELKQNHSNSILNEIKYELNKFFKDAECVNVLFTNNTDKLFFGMCVMPLLKDSDIDNIMSGDSHKVKVDKYYLEIDSKILDINLSNKELTACLLHEVGHIVNDTSGTEKIKNAISVYLANKQKNVAYGDLDKNREIFRLGVSTAISKIYSLFSRDDDELIADSFVVACGYGEELSSAYRTIIAQTGKLSKNVKNKLVVLQWSLSLLSNMKLSRIPAIDSLRFSEKVEPSKLVKNSIKHTIQSLIGYNVQTTNEGVMDKISGFFNDVSYSDIRKLENELYEYNIRIKNCDEEDDALILTRELNTRISILDDFMLSKKLSDANFKKCSDLKNRYIYIRKLLTDKKLYSGKYLGLFVDVPIIRKNAQDSF